jgi:integrase
MRALIGPDLIRKLDPKNTEIRDTKIVGFTIRCRASGAHVYRLTLGRGDTRTLGRVGKMTPEAARLAAEALVASVSRDAIKHMADDPTLKTRDAKAKARGAVKGAKRRRITWKAFVDEHYAPWVTAHRKHGADLVARLRVNFAEFDGTLLEAFSSFAIERWRTHRLKTTVADRAIKSSTVNRDLSALRGALSRAVEWGFLTTHPMATVKAAKEDRIGRLRYLSVEEEARLLAALDARDTTRREQRVSANTWRQARGYDRYPPYGPYTDLLSPMIRLALHTGLRFGELTALRWSDVDLVGALLTVRGEEAKSEKTRYIPLNTAAMTTLKTWRSSSTSAALVFPGADDDTEVVDIKTAWAPILKAARIAGFRFHDLRHTFASRLVMAGVDLNTVRELLGHADIKMTLRYAHLAPEHKAAAVAKLVAA